MSALDTTILIPTANRPGMLKNALRSVQTQPAAARIREVIVSDNGDPAGVASLCQEFRSTLPIRYIQRNPRTIPMVHGKVLLGDTYESKDVAIRNDDDWWMPEHLERSLGLLDKHETACAGYSAYLEVGSETETFRGDPFQRPPNLRFWSGGGFQSLTEEWVLEPEAVIMSCLSGTPGHFSSVVTRNSALKDSCYIYDLKNSFDNDRMLTLALALKSSLIFNPTPTVFVRLHPQQDAQSYTEQAVFQNMYRTTLWILEHAKEFKFDFLTALNRQLINCPSAYFPFLTDLLGKPWVISALTKAMQNRPALPSLGISSKKILFVTPDMSDSQGVRNLLHLLRWLRKKNDCDFELVLSNTGPLEKEFSQLTKLHSSQALAQRPEFLQRLFLESFDLIYSNTALNGLLLEAVSTSDLPIVTHIHESDSTIDNAGARNFAGVISHTSHFIVSEYSPARRLERRFHIPTERISVHSTIISTEPASIEANMETYPSVDSVISNLWRKIETLVECPPPASAHHNSTFAAVFSTWSTEEVPDSATL